MLEQSIRALGDHQRETDLDGIAHTGRHRRPTWLEQLDHRPVPQVDPVGAAAEPHEHRVSDHIARPRRGGRAAGDRRLGGQSQDQYRSEEPVHRHAAAHQGTDQPTTRDPRTEQHHPDQHSRDLDAARSSVAPSFEAVSARSGGGRGAEQHRGHPCVGAEVHPAGGRMAGEHHHGHERRRGTEKRDDGEAPLTASTECPPGDEWPDDVELLLDRQTPQVVEDRQRGGARPVVAGVGHQVPVGEVGEGPAGIAACACLLGGGAPHGDDRQHSGDHQRDRREQAPTAAGPELSQVDPPRRAPFADEHGGDQEPREGEEQVDTEEASRHPADVVRHHRRDGDATQAVQRGPVAGRTGAGSIAVGHRTCASPRSTSPQTSVAEGYPSCRRAS